MWTCIRQINIIEILKFIIMDSVLVLDKLISLKFWNSSQWTVHLYKTNWYNWNFEIHHNGQCSGIRQIDIIEILKFTTMDNVLVFDKLISLKFLNSLQWTVYLY
jgi:hypothetical protein